MNRNEGLGLLVFCMVILTLGCRFTTPTPVAWRGTETALVERSTASAQALIPSPTFTTTSSPTTIPTRLSTPIPSDGPWLLFPGKDGKNLFAVDRDTNMVTKIDLPSPFIASDLPWAVSSDYRVLLARAGDVRIEGDFALYKISARSLQPQKITSLISNGVQENLLDSNNRQAVYAVEAAIAPKGISWNLVDGKAVFPMAVDGDSTNLFRYNPTSNKVERVTSRYQQDLAPLWSPAGQILVFQEADTRNNPYRWRVSLIASMSMNDVERVNYLYSTSQDSLEEIYLGWLNASRLVVFTRTESGNRDLRLLNVNGGTPTVLFAGRFDTAAINPVDGSIALLIREETAQQNKQAPGIYLRGADSTDFTQALLGNYQWLEYDDGLSSFLASNQNAVVAFGDNGVSLMIPGTSRLRASPDGQWLVSWSETGAKLHTPDGTYLQQISTATIENLVWEADSKGFFLLQADGIYHSHFPRLDPVKISEDVYHEGGGLFNWLGSE